MRITLLFVILSTMFCLSSKAQSNIVEGEFLVMIKPEAETTFKTNVASLFPNLRVKKLGSMPIYKLFSDQKLNVLPELLLKTVKQLPSVILAQPNHYVQSRNTLPNDTRYNLQWQYNNTGQSGGTPGVDLDAELAWDVTTGGVTPNGDTIVIAILDGGYDTTHVDLNPNMWRNYHEIPNNGIDDDNNGYVDDYGGWNPATGNDDVAGGTHGTAVAGIVGAKGNNGVGVTGVNWDVKLMLIRYGANGSEEDVVKSYMYVLDARRRYHATNGQEGAFVVATNASFGLDNTFPSEAPIWCAMYDSLGAAGIISAGATANRNSNIDEVGDVPTACPSDYLIAVTNVRKDDTKEFQAGYGVEHIDIGAFGTDVHTITTNNGYTNFGGTSGATPHVAGAVGLLYSAPNPLLGDMAYTDPANAVLLTKELLITGSEDNANLQEITASGKRLNLNGVIQKYLNTNSACFSPKNLTAQANNDLSIDFAWSHSGAEHTLFYGTDNINFDSVTTAQPTVNLLGFDTCSAVYWYVRSKCDTVWSPNSDTMMVNSAGCCLPPSQLQVDSISGNEAKIMWNTPFNFSSVWVYIAENSSENLTDSILVNSEELWLTNLDSCTNYFVKLATVCADSLEFTNTTTFRTLNCSQCYSEDYCSSEPGDNSYEWIDVINLASSGWVANTGRNETYNFFGSDFGIPEINTFGTNQLSIDIGSSSSSAAERIIVHIDLNYNGIFDENEKVVNELASTSTELITNFSITANEFDYTRMRVQLIWNTSAGACDNYGYGEVEDYCVKIVHKVSVSEHENTVNGFAVHPIPATNTLFINNATKGTFSLFDVSGKLIKSGQVQAKIDVSDLEEGVYIMQIGNFSHRIIKQ